MRKMKRRKNFYVPNVRLSEFPTGEYKTPGFNGTPRTYSIFKPTYSEGEKFMDYAKSVEPEVLVQEARKLSSGAQQGFGEVPEIEVDNTQIKEKMDSDIYQKMQNPIFKTTKVKRSAETTEDRPCPTENSLKDVFAGPSTSKVFGSPHSGVSSRKKFKSTKAVSVPKKAEEIGKGGEGFKKIKKEKKYAVF